MLFCTDVQEVAKAAEAKAPRPIEEVWQEVFPGCTVDRNGRAHSPHDGYECPHTGQLYRAGEYLPEPDCESFRTGREVRPLMFVTPDWQVHAIEGTRAQRRAAIDAANAQALVFDRDEAAHVGEEKQRVELELTLMAVFHSFGTYGNTYTHYFRDAEWNQVVWKGSKLIIDVAGGTMKPGQTINAKVTVSSHWTSGDGKKRTYVKRPSFTSGCYLVAGMENKYHVRHRMNADEDWVVSVDPFPSVEQANAVADSTYSMMKGSFPGLEVEVVKA